MILKQKKLYFKILESTYLGYFVLLVFLFHQIYFIYIGGSTYDTIDLRFGSHKLYDKLLTIIKFDFTNPIFNEFTTTELFGLVLIFPAYIFAHAMNFSLFDSVSNVFVSSDAFIYFLMHLFLNIYVVLVLLYIYKLLKESYLNDFANLFLLFLILIPSFSGHSLFNLKDIPYTLQLFLVNLFLLNNYLKFNQKSVNKKRIYKLSFLIALSASIRINAYLFIFFTFAYILLYFVFKKVSIKIYLKESIASIFLSFIFLFIMSPQGWLRPKLFIEKSIVHQFNHGWPGSTLTNGNFVLAQDISPTYLIEWFFARLPLTYILSFLIFILFFNKLKLTIYSQYSLTFITMLFLLFPVLKPTAYDGLRHFLFIVPYFVILQVEIFLKVIKNSRYFVLISLFIFLYSFGTQFGLGAYKYTYFNETVNIEKSAFFCEENIDGCGNWPTDYWGFKGKEVAEFLNEDFQINNSQNRLMICKPKHTVENYLKDKVSTTTIDNLKSGEVVYIATFHRPRLNEDSCYFNLSELNYECSLYEKFTQKIRISEITLAYISECKLS